MPVYAAFGLYLILTLIGAKALGLLTDSFAFLLCIAIAGANTWMVWMISQDRWSGRR